MGMTDFQKIADSLFKTVEDGEQLYAILDSARSLEIAPALQNIPVERESLYRGRSEEPLWDVAPYLVRCERGAAVLQWLLEKGWGNSWGIFFISRSNLEDLRTHFQQFLLVKRENNKDFYFRFYDPRILRVFLPSCTIEQRAEIFGSLRCFLMEALNPDTLLQFALTKNGLTQKTINLLTLESQSSENSIS
jgi:Domain of unknown function (DUF4123)